MESSEYSSKSVVELRALLRESLSEDEAALISRVLEEKRREELVAAAENDTSFSASHFAESNSSGCLVLVTLVVVSSLAFIFANTN